MEYKEFIALVADMRKAQANYFRASMAASKAEYLLLSKKLEKQVDEQIIKLNSNQTTLL